MWRGFLILSLLIAGCGGPSAQQQYDTALDILEREQKELDRVTVARDDAMKTALDTVCQEFCGTSVHAIVADTLEESAGVMKRNRLDAPLPPNTDEADKRIDAMIKEMGDSEKGLDALTSRVAKESEAVAAVGKAINTPGTKEASRFGEIFDEMPANKAFLTQQKRVERAKKAVADAEAAL